MLLSFAARETTHMKAYKHLNDTLGYDDNAFMEEFLQFEQMVQKHSFIMEQVSLETPLGVAKYLVKQMLIEGVNLFASFAMLLSFSQEGKLPGMVSVNQWSIVDESLHVEGIAEVFKVYLKEHPEVVGDDLKRTAYETARAVVAMEDEFVDLCYSVGETSCTDPATLKQYIRYVCDYRMQQLGFKEQFGVKENPMEWIDQITGNTMSNFFETTTTQYSKGSLKGEWVYNV
jgi:ribonucleoside-diphosphate reductase beta chain